MARKIFGLILNILVPGVGTLVLGGRPLVGVVQLVLYLAGAFMRLSTGSISLVGDLLVIVMFVWAVVLGIMAFFNK